MSFVLRLPRKMHLCRSSSNVPCLPSFLEMPQNPHVLLTFEEVHNPLRLPRETTSEPPKVARTCGVLYMLTWKCASRHNGVHFFDTFSTSELQKVVRDRQFLTLLTWKCASRHNGVHFFDIATSKTASNPVTFYFHMCFAPQRRALFQHLNFQKWSDAEVFCTTTARNFSSLISPDVSAPTGLASLLINPPEPQNHEKTQCFATFLPFRAPASSFFWSFLFWLFSLPTAFSSLHIVGSLTSKLPSITRSCDIILAHGKGWSFPCWFIFVDP